MRLRLAAVLVAAVIASAGHEASAARDGRRWWPWGRGGRNTTPRAPITPSVMPAPAMSPGLPRRPLTGIEASARAADAGHAEETFARFLTAAALASDPASHDQIFELARLGDRGNGAFTRGAFARAMAIAGPEAGPTALALAAELDHDQSAATRATFALAAALAGQPARARAAGSLAQELDGRNGARSRALFTVAAALHRSPDEARAAHAIARGPARSREDEALFMIAIAGASPGRARRAIALAEELHVGGSPHSLALLTGAAALAGDDAVTRRAHAFAGELSFAHHSARAHAYHTLATVLAGDERTATTLHQRALEADHSRSGAVIGRLMLAFAIERLPAGDPRARVVAGLVHADELLDDRH